MMGLDVKPLVWTQKAPPGLDHQPFVFYAAGLGGHYTVEPNGLLWWAHDPFTFEQFGSRDIAKEAAQADHVTRVWAQLGRVNSRELTEEQVAAFWPEITSAAGRSVLYRKHNALMREFDEMAHSEGGPWA